MTTLHTIRMPGGGSDPKSTLARLGEYAFRPLFLLLALQALGMMVLWVCWWQGLLQLGWERNPVLWHGHEMISGFAAAAIGGFALTAVATWTSRPAVGGWRIWLLCALWLGARLSLFAPLAHGLFDIGYWLLLLILMSNEVLRAGNQRNIKILLVLALLLAVDVAWHLAELNGGGAWLRQATLAQLWLVIVLIGIVGGRIIPAFTGNWLRRQAAAAGSIQQAEPLPPPFGRIDLAAMLSLGAFALGSVLGLSGVLMLACGWLAAMLHAWRLVRWQGLRCLRDPLVWMLHLSYAWLPLGLALLACAAMGWLAPSAGIHALTVGCVAGMIVSVSARAALGHSNRPLVSHPLLTAAIVALNLAAVLRVCAALHSWPWLMSLSAFAWCAAFLGYAIVYVPILLGPPAGQAQRP